MYETITPQEIQAGRQALLGGNVGGSTNLIVRDVQGSTVYDMEGNAYLDCTSQAWSMNIGLKHPKVIKAVQEQAAMFSHIRTSFDTVPKLLLAKKLTELAPGNLKKVAFALHGGNAIEGAMKIALRNKDNSTKFITMYDGYHGRTFATMNMCWPHPNNIFLNWMNSAVRVPQAYCYRCPFNREYGSCGLECANFIDMAVNKAVDGPPAALIMETIQGNGGMIEYPKEFYQAIRQICDRHAMVLIWDEIQTGFGRPGTYFSSERYDTVPDIIVFGKALGGGYPIAGMLVNENLKSFAPGDQSFTFAHFPISMAASVATLEVMEEENICGQFREKGIYLTKRLKQMQEKYEIIGDVRGPGLMIGIELVKDRKTKEPFCKAEQYMVSEGLKRGLMLGGNKYLDMGNVVKIKPPAVVTYDELDKVLTIFEGLIKDCEAMRNK
ncbi:MAG: aspartate aminotransferase family protein [Clostridiales bacterium]|jgi:4-aminobutyrate aminotransferase/4-aminobutyrate aminotransferase/(S)-3-amino-2-methylpropionate transaminase|nr:aspartate aminotransferase family protein [Clostridiales bacterium]